MCRRSLLAAAAAAMAVTGNIAGTSEACHDLDESCQRWASAGECDKNVGYMKLYACRRSCDSCSMDVADLSPVAIVDESFMSTPRQFGSCATRVPENKRLRWGAKADVASEIGCFNRAGAEPKGSWEQSGLPKAAGRKSGGGTITFYDTASGLPLFVAPRNRTMEQFLEESRAHGWPSFRDEELVLDHLRQIRGTRGEIVSAAGMHLGHNLPDGRNRYCINLVSVAGHPPLGAALPGSRLTATTAAASGSTDNGRGGDDAHEAGEPSRQQKPESRPTEQLPAHSVEL